MRSQGDRHDPLQAAQAAEPAGLERSGCPRARRCGRVTPVVESAGRHRDEPDSGPWNTVTQPNDDRLCISK